MRRVTDSAKCPVRISRDEAPRPLPVDWVSGGSLLFFHYFSFVPCSCHLFSSSFVRSLTFRSFFSVLGVIYIRLDLIRELGSFFKKIFFYKLLCTLVTVLIAVKFTHLIIINTKIKEMNRSLRQSLASSTWAQL